MNKGGFSWRRFLGYGQLILAANYMYFLGLRGVHTWEHPLYLLPVLLAIWGAGQWLRDLKPRSARRRVRPQASQVSRKERQGYEISGR